ncbi:hypothetical protein [Pseudoclavibacter sp. AY1F1]|uniref:hypothetical protein n=1 Tax=Pseudoclavibacter sp. AY1F1 TaxID=2080583 RepID=UPI0011AFFEDF|nr:hypothetical protein [Pseudoclavibacter sp. AY1F1]
MTDPSLHNEDDRAIRAIVQRRAGLMNAIGGIALLLVFTSTILEQLHAHPLWWWLLATLMATALIATLPLTFVSKVTTLELLWTFVALANLALIVTALTPTTVGAPQPELDLSDVPWPWLFQPTAIACAGLVWSRKIAVGYALLSTTLPLTLSLLFGYPLTVELFSQTLAHLGDIVFLALIVLLRAQMTTAALAERSLAQRIRDVARAEAVLRAKQRAVAFVHDELLSTLNSASTLTADHAPRIQLAADASLTSLESELEDEGPHLEGTVTCNDLELRLRRSAEDLDLKLSTQLVSTHGELPLTVSTTVAEAALAALVNAERHARRGQSPATVRFIAHITPASVVVTVEDDGPGFLVEETPADRLGVRVSISQRMRLLPGGLSRITSTIGTGTRVELTWRSVDGENSTYADNSTRDPQATAVSGMGDPIIRTAFLFVWCTFLGQTLLHANARLAQELPSLIVLLVAVLVVTSPGPDRLSRRRKAVFAASVGLGLLWTLAASPDTGTALATRHFELLGYLCALLALRGNFSVAWPVFAATVVTLAVMLAADDRDFLVHFTAIAGAGLITGTSWNLILRHQLASITRHRSKEERALVALRERDLAMSAEQSRLTLIAERVSPVLEEISASSEVREATRLRARLLENELRDTIRAPRLAGGRLADAAASARARGARVTLIDDSGDGAADLSDSAEESIHAALSSPDFSEITVRLSPPGRSSVGTIRSTGAGGITRIQLP